VAENVLIVNFGTFFQTNHFKALALDRGFVDADLMENTPPPTDLVSTKVGGIRKWRDGGVTTLSFYGLSDGEWRSVQKSGQSYREAFRAWMNAVLGDPAQCMYLTGHHWDLTLSWGESRSSFHARLDADRQRLTFGTGTDKKYLVEVRSDKLREQCYLIFGFGCDVASPLNSASYQKFFRGGGSKPIILGWDRTIGVQKRNAPAIKAVSDRFFAYLDGVAASNSKVPTKGRLKWFYTNEPMELIRAWGHATTHWFHAQARARDQNGALFEFRLDRAKDTSEPLLSK
jgi:hypothetical protein